MALRSGHGKGRGRPHIEILPADEQPPATPALTVRADRSSDGRFAAGNTVSRARRCRPSNTGELARIINQADPMFRTLHRWGNRLRSHRMGELAKAHGGSISAGVGALVDSAVEARVDEKYVRAKAIQSGDPALLKLASTLRAEARQHELAAWELASREAATRPKQLPAWLTAPLDEE